LLCNNIKTLKHCYNVVFLFHCFLVVTVLHLFSIICILWSIKFLLIHNYYHYQSGGLDFSYLSVCVSLSVHLVKFTVKDIKRLWPIHTVQTSNMQYAFGVQVYGEVLYLEFYSVFSEQFINDEILLCKRL